MAVGSSEAEAFWLDFLRTLKRRGLAGVKLVVPDAHEGLKAAVTKVLRAPWQRCRVGPLKKPMPYVAEKGLRLKLPRFRGRLVGRDQSCSAMARTSYSMGER